MRNFADRNYFRWLFFPPFFPHGFIFGLSEKYSRSHLPKRYCRLVYFEVPGLDHPVQTPFARLQTVVSGSPDALESCRKTCIYAPLNDHPCSQAPGIFGNNELVLFILFELTSECHAHGKSLRSIFWKFMFTYVNLIFLNKRKN